MPAIAHDTAPAPAPEEAGLGRAALLGSLAGLTVIGLVIAATAVAIGVDVVGALGLGAFVGVWGGVGFGLMVGGTFTLVRNTEKAGH